tara:strand:- start:3762 stop:3866 length:105 start_codon:yes stop_codon:yes gene_type:complete
MSCNSKVSKIQWIALDEIDERDARVKFEVINKVR